MSNIQSARIRPAFGGMNSEASPEYVPDNQAAVLENLLPRPGKVVLRGPISAGIDIGLGANTRISGAMALGSGILLTDGAAAMHEIQSGVRTAGNNQKPGTRFCALGAYAYAIPQDGAALLKQWDGAGVDVSLLNGPTICSDITVHLSRLFVVGENNELRWSDVGGAPLDLAAEWTDDVSGLVNKIVVGDANDRLSALGHVGKQLALFKSGSIYMLTGLTPASFAVNRVTSEWGCVSPESVVDHDDGCFFLAERGFGYFDGSNVIDVSGEVKTEILQAVRDAPYPFYSALNRYGAATLLPFARAAAVGRDCIMLTIGRESNSGAPTIYFCGIYDTRQRTWTRFSSDAFTVGAPVYFIPTATSSYYAGATLGYDGAGNLMYLDDIVTPESAASTLCGEDTVDGTTVAIPAASYSRIISLSSPGKTSQLQRLLLDYTFAVTGGSDTVDCWSVSLVDGQGNVLLDPTPIPASTAVVRQRFQVEFFGDASEVQLRITLPALDPSVTGVKAAEIHDATIEFVPGRDRPIR